VTNGSGVSLTAAAAVTLRKLDELLEPPALIERGDAGTGVGDLDQDSGALVLDGQTRRQAQTASMRGSALRRI
jgi:hypothetical protein